MSAAIHHLRGGRYLKAAGHKVFEGGAAPGAAEAAPAPEALEGGPAGVEDALLLGSEAVDLKLCGRGALELVGLEVNVFGDRGVVGYCAVE